MATQAYQANRNTTPSPEWERNFNVDWIKVSITKECIEYTKKFGKFLSDRHEGNLTTSQIRMVYGELKRIQMKGFEKEQTAFLLLRPKMAYADKRNESNGLKELKKVFDKAYQYVETAKHFDNFMNFMEATLAYHKAFGGK